MDYGPSHAWHRTRSLRYIIILVENDVMHFKTFVLCTPSVHPQMMSLAFAGTEVISGLWEVCLKLSPSCGRRAVLKGRTGSKLGCGQLFITEPEDNVAHNRCPWCNCTDVVCWVRDKRHETDTLDVT